jgi:hypothetical protein
MTDPHAPDGYCFEHQEELEKAFADAREVADRLNDLSFGDAATKIQRAVYQIEHHAKEDHWTRSTRAAHAYLMARIGELKHPHVCYSYNDEGETDRLNVDFEIPLHGMTVTEFIDQWDPGNAFDKVCPICGAKPKNPCLGSVDEGHAVHQERRFV